MGNLRGSPGILWDCLRVPWGGPLALGAKPIPTATVKWNPWDLTLDKATPKNTQGIINVQGPQRDSKGSKGIPKDPFQVRTRVRRTGNDREHHY